MADKKKGIVIEIGGDVTPLNDALKEVNGTAKNLQTELNFVNKALKLDSSNTEMVRQKQVLLKEAVANTSSKLETLKEAQRQADEQMKNGTDVDQEQYRKLQREIAFTEAKLKSYKDEMSNVHASIQAFGEKLDDIGEKSEKLGKKFLPVTGAVVAVGTGATTMAVSFEDAMAKVSTLMDETEVSFSDMRASILELSNQTGISAVDIAENVYDALSSDTATADAVAFVAEATKLTKAGFAESADSVDVLTTILTAYRLEASDVSKISDILIKTQDRGKTSVGELGKVMGKVIPTAKANGVEFEQVAAAFSLMTINGIATAETTTYFNSMLNELGKTGSRSDKVLREKTGKSFKELSESGTTIGDVLAILNDYAKEANLNFTDLWGSTQAGRAGVVLLGEGAEYFNSEIEEMNNATGMADANFAKLQTTSETAKIAFNQLKNVSIELGGTIITMLQPVITNISDKIKEFSQWFSNLNDGQKKFIVYAGLVIGAIAPLLITFGKVATGISSIIKFAGKIAPMMDGIKSAFVLLKGVIMANPIAFAIGALITIIILLYTKCEWFRDGVNAIWEKIKEVFLSTFETMKTFFTETIPDAIKTLVTSIEEFFVNGWEKIVSFFTESIPNFIASVVTWLEELPYNVGLIIGKIIGTVIKFGIDAVSWVQVNVPLIIKTAIDFIKELPSKVWEWLKATLTKIGEFGSNAITKAVEIGSKFVKSLIDFIKELPSNVWKWLTDTFKKVTDFTANVIAKGAEAGKGLFDAVVDGVKDLPSKMFSIGGDIVRGVWDGITSLASWLSDKVSNFFGGIVDGVKSTLGINSPSRVMADEVGEHLPTGVAMGIDETAYTVNDSLENMVGNSVENAKHILSDFNNTAGLTVDAVIGNPNTTGTTTSNNYGQNHIEIHTNSLDTENIETICNEINYRLGLAY